MKRLFSLILSIICCFSAIGITACDYSCTHEKSDKVSYTESNGVVTIAYNCVKCGKVASVVETVTADYVIEGGDCDAISRAYVHSRKDLVFFLKAGFYDIVYLGHAYGTVRALCEDGVRIRKAQVGGGFDGVTLENATFKADPKTESSMFKFETAGGSAYWSNITIKNCHFEGKAYINRSWTSGIVDNLTVENCTFKNITDNYDGLQIGTQYSAIFIEEVWGTTLIKDCVFDGFEYAAIRLGERSNEGDTIVENCYFSGLERPDGIAIYFKIKNDKLDDTSVSLSINNCVFNCDSTLRWVHESSVLFPQLILGENKWKNIPDWIEDFATEYSVSDQQLLK